MRSVVVKKESEMHATTRLNALPETVAQLRRSRSPNANNPILSQLHSRLRSNDPSLTSLSLCRLPVFHLPFTDVAMLVQSLYCNKHVKDLELWIPSTDEGTKDDDGDEVMHNDDEDSSTATLDLGDGRRDSADAIDVGGQTSCGVTDYASFAAALAASSGVDTLTVAHAPSEEAWCLLFEALKESPSVKHVVLGEATVNPMPLADSACCALAGLIAASGVQSLTVRGTYWSLQGARILAAGLCLGSLERLELHQVEIRTDPTDPATASSLLFGQFVAALASAPIASLAIMDCDLRLEGVDEDAEHPLTAFAASTSHIRSLSLLDSIDVDGIRPLALGWLSNPSTQLSTLDVRYNTLSVISCEALSELLARPDLPLQELLMDEASLDDECVQALCSTGLAMNTSLRKLTLRGNSLSPRSCAALQGALSRHPSLQVLDVSENKLMDSGAAFLASLLGKNSTMREVSLEATNLTDAGVANILSSLAHNRTVVALSLGRNQVHARAAQELSNLLGVNGCALTEIDLNSCKITDEVFAGEILPSLCRNRTLQSLCLAYNAVGNEGIRLLGQCLPSLRVRSLDLQFNDFDAAGLGPLVAGLRGNYLLHRLNVTNESTQHAAGAASEQGFATAAAAAAARWMDQITWYTRLNRAGRRAIQADAAIPPALRPAVLAKAATTPVFEVVPGPFALFHILRHQPHYATYVED